VLQCLHNLASDENPLDAMFRWLHTSKEGSECIFSSVPRMKLSTVTVLYTDGVLPCARLTSARSGWAVSHVEYLSQNRRSFLSLHLCRDFLVAHGTLLSFPPLQLLQVLSNLPSQSSAFLVSVLYLYIHKMYALHFLYGYVMRLHTVLFKGQMR